MVILIRYFFKLIDYYIIIIFIFSKVVFSQVEVYTKAINLPTYGWVKDINPRLRFNLPIKTMDIECYPYDAHDALTGVKKDKYYEATVIINDTGTWVNYKLEF